VSLQYDFMTYNPQSTEVRCQAGNTQWSLVDGLSNPNALQNVWTKFSNNFVAASASTTFSCSVTSMAYTRVEFTLFNIHAVV
jgi:hypothetical protein